jgi:hypothetical protein
MTIEELEREKITEEIRQLRRPFWKSPSYITIITAVLIAAASYIKTQNTEQQVDS